MTNNVGFCYNTPPMSSSNPELESIRRAMPLKPGSPSADSAHADLATNRLIYPETGLQLYQALDTLPIAVAIIGHNDRNQLVYGNPAFHSLRPEDIKSISNVLHVPIIETEKGVLSMLVATKTDKGTHTINVCMAKDGPWYELTVSPTSESDGKAYAQIMIHDITRYKLREGELTRIQEEEGRRRDQELSRVDHDLKNAVGPINGLALIAQRELRKKQPRPETIARSIDLIVQSTGKCIAMIVDEIEKLKLSSELRKETIAIAEVLESVSDEHLCSIEQAGIETEFLFPAADLKLIGDTGRLSSVFRILIVNAIQAMEGCESKKLTIAYKVKNGQILIYIKDTGLGIPEQNKRKIFNGFSTKIDTDQNGTGIGLPMARRIARAHNGDVQLVASVTKEMLRENPELKQTGSTFAVFLPLPQEIS